MLLEEGLFTALSTAPEVTGVVGTRIYPVLIPQHAILPALVYKRIGTLVTDLLAETGLLTIRMELTYWGGEYLAMKRAAKALRTLLQPDLDAIGGVPLAGLSWVNEQDAIEETLLLMGVASEYEFTISED